MIPLTSFRYIDGTVINIGLRFWFRFRLGSGLCGWFRDRRGSRGCRGSCCGRGLLLRAAFVGGILLLHSRIRRLRLFGRGSFRRLRAVFSGSFFGILRRLRRVCFAWLGCLLFLSGIIFRRQHSFLLLAGGVIRQIRVIAAAGASHGAQQDDDDHGDKPRTLIEGIFPGCAGICIAACSSSLAVGRFLFRSMIGHIADPGAGDGCGGPHAATSFFGNAEALSTHTVPYAGFAEIDPKRAKTCALAKSKSHVVFSLSFVSESDTFIFYPRAGGKSQGKLHLHHPADDADLGLAGVVDLRLVLRVGGLRH